MKTKTLYVVAAGSGGHILPALTLAQHWLKQNPQGKVVFWGSNKQLDKKILANASFLSQIIGINITGFSLKKIWQLPTLIFWTVYAFCKCFFYSLKQRPEKIICTGGLIGLPICFAGRLALVPVEIFELNVIPGKAIKLLMPFANTIHVVFQETKKDCRLFFLNFEKKCKLTHYPIRFTDEDRTNQNKRDLIACINATFNPSKPFNPDRKTIFILGGSQGSSSLNAGFVKVLKGNKFLQENVQIIHQTGGNSTEFVASEYKALNIPAFTFTYQEELRPFYLLSDLIICRAGAGTIFEIEFFEKRCIVIPLIASTTSHQIQNAIAMVQKHPHLFTLITQKDLSTNHSVLENEILHKL